MEKLSKYSFAGPAGLDLYKNSQELTTITNYSQTSHRKLTAEDFSTSYPQAKEVSNLHEYYNLAKLSTLSTLLLL